MIKVENLTRRYGDFAAVSDVSFSIGQGQIVGLLGHNGAGKTTVMKTLTGYLEPSEGQVLIAGMDVVENRMAVQDKIGYLPESSPLYPDMLVVQYLEYVCEMRGVDHNARPSAIRAAIDRTGLESVALKLVSTLSKGYKQRVGVAQAIIHNPEILILDEPTSGLDPAQIHEMRGLIKQLSKNSTVILSTHILQEVEATCDRVLIMLQGRLAADSLLSDLRVSNRLLLEVDRELEAVQGVLRKIGKIKSIRCSAVDRGRAQYIVDLERESEDIVPRIAKAAVAEGWGLYRLNREQRNLEAVFREINESGMKGGTHER
ncbi:MAG: ATP-binding cassette domain-containing protein [Deltaproteobacteria bacterium]|nr:ATP-binding cassette domain-containing protein [Deltaproteobacteria bacterium]